MPTRRRSSRTTRRSPAPDQVQIYESDHGHAGRQRRPPGCSRPRNTSKTTGCCRAASTSARPRRRSAVFGAAAPTRTSPATGIACAIASRSIRAPPSRWTSNCGSSRSATAGRRTWRPTTRRSRSHSSGYLQRARASSSVVVARASTADRTVRRKTCADVQPSATALATLRRLLLGILLFGLVGTATELLLIGHDEDAWQLIPLVVLASWRLLGRGLRRRVRDFPSRRGGHAAVPSGDGAADAERRDGFGASLPRQHGIQARDGSVVARVGAVLECAAGQGAAGAGARKLAAARPARIRVCVSSSTRSARHRTRSTGACSCTTVRFIRLRGPRSSRLSRWRLRLQRCRAGGQGAIADVNTARRKGSAGAAAHDARRS